jgi:hypothetical protein
MVPNAARAHTHTCAGARTRDEESLLQTFVSLDTITGLTAVPQRYSMQTPGILNPASKDSDRGFPETRPKDRGSKANTAPVEILTRTAKVLGRHPLPFHAGPCMRKLRKSRPAKDPSGNLTVSADRNGPWHAGCPGENHVSTGVPSHNGLRPEGLRSRTAGSRPCPSRSRPRGCRRRRSWRSGRC